MGASVTIDASRRVGIAPLNRLTVKTAVVGRLLVGVTRRTGDSEGWSFVRRTLNVRMAVDAGKHAAVDGIFESLGVDVQADRLALDFMGQCGITVAGEAFFRGRFRKLFAS